jgi:hypothetical protein
VFVAQMFDTQWPSPIQRFYLDQEKAIAGRPGYISLYPVLSTALCMAFAYFTHRSSRC